MQPTALVLALAFIVGAVPSCFASNAITPRAVSAVSEKATVPAKPDAAAMADPVQPAARSKADCAGKACDKKAAKENFILSRSIYKSHKRCKPVGCKYVNYHVFSTSDERYEVARKLTVFGPSGRAITEAVEKRLQKRALIVDGLWSFDQEADQLIIRAKRIRDKLDDAPIRPQPRDTQEESDQ